MGLLDEILDGPKVVSEQHDVNQIDAQAGMMDWREMVKVGKIIRKMGETDEQLAQRAMKVAAIRRAALDTSTGKVAVMVAGKPPWHKLGVNIESATDSKHAIKLASLDWMVDKLPLYYYADDGTKRQAPGVYGIVREDTKAMLGKVGSRYQPIQNKDGFAFLDIVLKEYGARYESAGSIYGGEKVWMLVHLPEQAFKVGGKDEVEPYALFSNPHDGSGRAWCFPTTERVVCANTFRVAQKDRGKGIGIRHTGNVRERIQDAKVALRLAVEGFDEFRQQAEVLVKTKMPEPERYFNGILDAVLDMTEAEALKGSDALAAALKVEDAKEREHKRKLIQNRIDNRTDILEDILTRYESANNGVHSIRGSAWSGFSAVTEFADHSPLVRYKGSEDSRLSRRFESTLAGEADEMKQIAFSQAIASAKA